jgi:hypothetical protein
MLCKPWGQANKIVAMQLTIVADGFNLTSFHGFLAKRLLLRGSRLLKHIGVAAVVQAGFDDRFFLFAKFPVIEPRFTFEFIQFDPNFPPLFRIEPGMTRNSSLSGHTNGAVALIGKKSIYCRFPRSP